ncbi:YbaB/EbfC family nucleoid-associated protein [bacterium]|nr:YbaB/EbfC family nucleoid-associated protein [bacterium]
MFENLKKLKQLKEIQKSLAQEKIEIQKEGVKIVMNGKMEVEEIQLNPQLDHIQQSEVLKRCINEAFKKMQIVAAQKMMQHM